MSHASLERKPGGPVPSARQLKWHALETYGFVHFTVNTFTDKEWGYGDEAAAVFNPTDFDADQIAEAARAGGLKGLILTCKHHDGFCLWPSAFTEHSVKNSPWRNGRGDVVRDLSEACARQGILFGVYLSPWDRNRHDYAQPGYIEYYRRQLRELLGNYGPLFEVWFDGANGGDGYYGGAREERRIDKLRYYDWENTWAIVRELQLDACMFSDAGPDIRWVGNEAGVAGDPCWATLDADGIVPGQADTAVLNSGCRHGGRWMPAECDVSIRPGWFYHAAEDDKVKSPTALVDLYYQSVGRGASLLLNLPPDRRGRIPDRDVESLAGFRAVIERTFAVDLAKRAKAMAAQATHRTAANSPSCVNDGRADTYWSPAEGTAPELVLEFDAPVTFDVIGLREYLPLGQRIDAFTVDAWTGGRWRELARGTAVGNRRLIRVPAVSADKVRLRIVEAAAPPAVSELFLGRQAGA